MVMWSNFETYVKKGSHEGTRVGTFVILALSLSLQSSPLHSTRFSSFSLSLLHII
ncbi:hypothetical protein YC2023_098807 [Brassica napus]